MKLPGPLYPAVIYVIDQIFENSQKSMAVFWKQKYVDCKKRTKAQNVSTRPGIRTHTAELIIIRQENRFRSVFVVNWLCGD